MKFFSILIKYTFPLVVFLSFFTAYASTTNGTIDGGNHYAILCKNYDCTISTKVNFKAIVNNPNVVSITDAGITGDIWSEDMGWIRLNPGGGYGGVVNDSNGNLSGYAFGNTAGWISFNCGNEVSNNCATNGNFKVTINNVGEFTGYAWSENYGWIKFDCGLAGACVKTDWRPMNTRSNGNTPPASTATSSSSGSGSIPFLPSITIVPINTPVYYPPVKVSTVSIPKDKIVTQDTKKDTFTDLVPIPEVEPNLESPMDTPSEEQNTPIKDIVSTLDRMNQEDVQKSESSVSRTSNFMNTIKSIAMSISFTSLDISFRYKDYDVYISIPTIDIVILLILVFSIIWFIRRRNKKRTNIQASV